MLIADGMWLTWTGTLDVCTWYFQKKCTEPTPTWQNLGLTKYNTQTGYTREQIKQSNSNQHPPQSTALD